MYENGLSQFQFIWRHDFSSQESKQKKKAEKLKTSCKCEFTLVIYHMRICTLFVTAAASLQIWIHRLRERKLFTQAQLCRNMGRHRPMMQGLCTSKLCTQAQLCRNMGHHRPMMQGLCISKLCTQAQLCRNMGRHRLMMQGLCTSHICAFTKMNII